MVVIGAGGHALEVLDVLLETFLEDNLYFYDDSDASKTFFRQYKILKSEFDIQTSLSNNFNFILGVGNPQKRRYLYDKFKEMGGQCLHFKSLTSSISRHSENGSCDVMKNCFIGPDTVIGKASLINTGSQIHHEVQIGEFSEVSPHATILGKAKVGNSCSIGANSIILPGITIGANVVIGAGAVVTKNISDNSLAVGNPAKVIRTFTTSSF